MINHEYSRYHQQKHIPGHEGRPEQPRGGTKYRPPRHLLGVLEDQRSSPAPARVASTPTPNVPAARRRESTNTSNKRNRRPGNVKNKNKRKYGAARCGRTKLSLASLSRSPPSMCISCLMYLIRLASSLSLSPVHLHGKRHHRRAQQAQEEVSRPKMYRTPAAPEHIAVRTVTSRTV